MLSLRVGKLCLTELLKQRLTFRQKEWHHAGVLYVQLCGVKFAEDIKSSCSRIDIAVKLIDSAITFLSKYRQSGFADAQSTVKEP